MKIRATILTLLFLAVSAFAADVDGKWKGSVNTPNGDIPVAFDFKADGPTLTGSMLNMDGSNVAIKDGKVNGSDIAFSVTLDFGGMPFTLNYKGVVSGDEIKLSGDAMGNAFEFVVKRAK